MPSTRQLNHFTYSSMRKTEVRNETFCNILLTSSLLMRIDHMNIIKNATIQAPDMTKVTIEMGSWKFDPLRIKLTFQFALQSIISPSGSIKVSLVLMQAMLSLVVNGPFLRNSKGLSTSAIKVGEHRGYKRIASDIYL